MIFDPTVKVDPDTVRLVAVEQCCDLPADHIIHDREYSVFDHEYWPGPKTWHSYEDGVWDFEEGVIVLLAPGEQEGL